MSKNSRIVYSTDKGRIKDIEPSEKVLASDTTVKVTLEKKGRGGKQVTVLTDIPASKDELNKLLNSFKKKCGSGGTIKLHGLEIQGDHVDMIIIELHGLGFKAKRAGG